MSIAVRNLEQVPLKKVADKNCWRLVVRLVARLRTLGAEIDVVYGEKVGKEGAECVNRLRLKGVKTRTAIRLLAGVLRRSPSLSRAGL